MKPKMSSGLIKFREPSPGGLGKMALEELRRRSERAPQGEIPLSEAADLLGCDRDQVVNKIDGLMGTVPDFWDWAVYHGDGFVAVGHRFTRRKAAQIKRLMKRPEFKQVSQLPSHALFRAREVAKTLNLPPRKVSAWLAHCVHMGYLRHSILVPSRGPRMTRWQRNF
jgi:hypothetical protein